MAETLPDRLYPRPTDDAVFGIDNRVSSVEPTYGGVLSFFRRRYTRQLDGVDVALWGIPFDCAVSNRSGTRFGPQSVRRASVINEGDPHYPFHFDLFEVLNVVDCGDCSFDYARVADVPDCITKQASDILASGATLVSVGGDHSITWPLLRAHHARHGKLALVHFDAHQDTWGGSDPDRIDHGSFVTQAVGAGLIDASRSIQVGIRTHAPEDCGFEILHGEDVHEIGIHGVVDRIRRRVGDAPCYLTFDIDVLDPAFAPGTGTPVSGGLLSREAMMILRRLGFLDIRGFDMVEVSPPYDHADITSIAGATVVQAFLGLLAERKKGARTA
jgi:agmatinase